MTPTQLEHGVAVAGVHNGYAFAAWLYLVLLCTANREHPETVDAAVSLRGVKMFAAISLDEPQIRMVRVGPIAYHS